MKKKLKLYLVIAITGMFFLVFTGCGPQEAFLRIVNNNANTITAVKVGTEGRYNDGSISPPELYATNLNITTGSSQTFSLGTGWDRPNGREVTVYFGNTQASFWDESSVGEAGGERVPYVVPFQRGETVTITLNADGTLTF